MTPQEVRAWLTNRPFQPFRINMNNREAYEVFHPELAIIADTGALHVFAPATTEEANTATPLGF